jgi:hypothetical protein
MSTQGLRHGSRSHRPARNYKIRRLVHESMHAEGTFDAWPPAYVPLSSMKLSVHDDAEGAFSVRPLAYVPSSSPS